MNLRDALNISSNYCPVLWGEIAIDQHGYIIFCCHSSKTRHAHISEIDDLEEFFNGRIYSSTRQQLIENNIVAEACVSCIGRNRNNIPTYRTHNLMNNVDVDINNYSNLYIRNIEINFSNLCNQQCVMCDSSYSSKWYVDDFKLKDSKFRRTPVKTSYSLTEQDILKIKKILKNISTIVIKGGEPTIDPMFKKLIASIAEESPETNIRLVTNFQEISPDLMANLSRLTNLTLIVSIDGTYNDYNWVRGGNFEKMVNNLKLFHASSVKPQINYTSAFNAFNIRKICKYINDISDLNGTFNRNKGNNLNLRIVSFPMYASPFSIPIEERRKYYSDLTEMIKNDNEDVVKYKSLKIRHIKDLKLLASSERFSKEWLMYKEWEDQINKIRGYELDK